MGDAYTPERWRQIKQVLHAALELEPDGRAAFLAEACANDGALRREVEALLSADGNAGKFLETPVRIGTSLKEGTRLGPYEILAPIGAGGMGEVYRGRDTRLQRTVAIKILSANVMHDPERRRRFLQEARAASALNHPNIVTLHDIGSDSGVDFFVMEYVPETSLDRRIPSKPFSLAEILDCGIQIANALAAAHAAGIIHRDIKPANVMVTREGQVKVLDFGLAKWPENRALDQDAETGITNASLTQAGQVMGTVAYMSPEQARGERLDARTDLFSFGTVLYEMATGRAAFPKAFDWTPPPARDVDSSLYRIILKLLQPDREERYASAADAASDLKGLQQALQSSQSRNRRRLLLASALAVASLSLIAFLWLRPTQPTPQNQWVQLTNLPDPVSQPALSPDGRMLAFVRGPDTFVAHGEIYVKMLPAGEAVQLTRDGASKMSPVFSPDGSRIAYTVLDGPNWDTWVVPVLNGQPRLWLKNASGLVWSGRGALLFSEIMKDIHMAVVTADETRAQARDIYVPASDRGMGHRSYPSPDGNWALIVEMDRGQWLPCRLVSISAKSASRQVGPANGSCTFAAWSLDGRWMYLSSSADGRFHIWRQRFPDGRPEQITSGLTEEEGIAMSPDGRSFVTAVGLRQSVVWIHDSTGDRQISLEGYSYDPKFTPDGKNLCYRILKGALTRFDPSELRVVELNSGHTEPLLPGLAIFGSSGTAYDISGDGRQVVAAVLDREGKRRLWLAALDRQSAPREIPNVEGDQPFFGANGEIFFRLTQRDSAFAYRVGQDGTGLRKVSEQSIAGLDGISPDGQWVTAKTPGEQASIIMALPTGNGLPFPIVTAGALGDYKFFWSQNKIFIAVADAFGSSVDGRTYVVPLPPGQAFPKIPPGGLRSEAELSGLLGARMIDSYVVAPGPTSDMYAFARASTQRNLYKIPLP